MDKSTIMSELKTRQMEDIIELIEDAERGHLEELELVKSVGLLYDKALNEAIISLLEDNGVKIIYLSDEE
ncbi:hypothetical protein [Bacillus sp. FJAT-45037]|uniref:hypothetical protein n=1 Tax=Bacillus sp. FJAT-45037 TaxID=2011007 RepID=UPI000C23275A|nr:hypothetical protein [Bacillus sp. FJAT-45037]